jgi:3-oxoacyl-[acyl-carrier-protein] synthase II
MKNIRRDPHQTRIVITGLGTINPIAKDVPEFWENLVLGKSGVRVCKNTDITDAPIKIGGEVDLPDPTGYYSPKMVRRLERFILFSQIAAVQAFRDSGMDQAAVDAEPWRYGVIIGTGDGGNDGHYKMCRQLERSGYESVSPFYVVGVIPNTPSAFFAKDYNFQGPNFSVNSACATSNHAIGIAASMIKSGLADLIMAGGTESVMNQAGIAGFGVIRALSDRNDDPQTASRPFDKNRNGFVLGEGAGVICLEELEHAKKRGARIYAELTGYGFSCDAYDLVAPHPDGRGAAMAMEIALEDAKLAPQSIDLINAHGTSTPLGDQTESNTICRVFGEYGKNVPVHSTKSMIGHLIGAGGGTEAIAAILALTRGVAHPSINVFEQDPQIPLNVIRNQPMEKSFRNVLSNSFGFGGQNATIILSKFEG